MRASHDSRETFARVSHDVRANFDQFYLSQLSLKNGLIYVASLSHCADCGNFLAMCLIRKSIRKPIANSSHPSEIGVLGGEAMNTNN